MARWNDLCGSFRLVEFALPNLKQFTLAALGAKTEEMKQKALPVLNKILNEACTDKQPMRKTKVFLSTRMNEGGTFTKHYFTAV